MWENLTSSDKPQVIYMIVLLIFLISSLVFRRDFSFFKMLKYLALWSFVAFVTISIYSYRHELRAFKHRILGTINPSQAQITAQGQIVLNISADGHYYVDTKINGSPVRFMIDTGASDIVIGINTANYLGINQDNSLTFNRAYQTANGTVYGARFLIDEFEMSGIKFDHVFATISNVEMETPLLGMSFLRRFQKYEFYQDRLVLTP